MKAGLGKAYNALAATFGEGQNTRDVTGLEYKDIDSYPEDVGSGWRLSVPTGSELVDFANAMYGRSLSASNAYRDAIEQGNHYRAGLAFGSDPMVQGLGLMVGTFGLTKPFVPDAGKMSRRSGVDTIDYDGNSATASFGGTEFLKEVAGNRVSMKSYQQISDHGADILFKYDSAIDDLAVYYPNSRRIDLYPANIEAEALAFGHDPAHYAARVLSHEAKHVRRDSLGLLTNTRYDEYLSYRREFLFQENRRPTLSERANLWQDVSVDYFHLDVGKRPISSWEAFEK
ncbi:MAG: hypothetical protein DBP02_14275 [gamma proteobacterium symbiont of Ctena orbiculata]|nr:MAG: hypothetical protein DBP02_14275 [gamma proteobacterium symbiont of Ctena orbiculata]